MTSGETRNLGSQEHSDGWWLFTLCLKLNLDQGRQHPGRAEMKWPRTLLP